MIKTPWTRVLDLTCGWYEFVERGESREEEPLTDDRLLAQELFVLYQTAGAEALEEPEDREPSPETEAKVRAFVNDKILPLLLRR